MKTCKSCETVLMDVAQFCHNCGRQVAGNAIVCLKCSTPNPGHAKFCFNCGYPINVQYIPKTHISPRFKLDFNDVATLPTQLKDAFLLYISYLLEIEGIVHTENQIHLPEQGAALLLTFETSGFRRIVFEEAALQLAETLEQLYTEGRAAAFPVIESRVELLFLDVGELFWLEYVPHLMPFPLSKAILRYQGSSFSTVNLQQMIHDYLMLSDEPLVFHLHAVDIPIKKLSNARKGFFKHDSGEFPLVFIDQTLFGSGKEGLIITQKNIYWKAAFHKAESVPLNQIQKIKYLKNHIEINGLYCNLTDSLNYKLFKLLYRIKVICL